MVGGGIGSFIGGVHRMAASIDGQIDLVCGAFSSDPSRSYESGKQLLLPDNRIYQSYDEMIAKEKALPASQRMDFLSVVTPNHVHFKPCKMALENGFHVICDKPVTISLNEAKELKSIVEKTDLLFALTHNYTAYPMVKQAREMVKSGQIGKIRKVIVEYSQGWLATKLEDTGQKQAAWRADPSKSGSGGAIGDIGTHAANLAEYITDVAIDAVCADLTSFVDGRLLDDDANVLLRFANGAKGVLHVSQICVGEENNLKIKVFGETGGIEWEQQEPNSLQFRSLDQPLQIFRTASSKVSDVANQVSRIPAGHPEGYLEAFATIYQKFSKVIRNRKENVKTENHDLDFPSIDEGIRGMAFIEKVIVSSKGEQKWIKLSQ